MDSDLVKHLKEAARNWKVARNKLHPRQPLEVGTHYFHDATDLKTFLAANPRHRATDCTIFVHDVIQYAYTQVGDVETAARLPNGLSLFPFLTDQKGWKALFWSSDVARPRANAERGLSGTEAYISVRKTRQYRPKGPNPIDVTVELFLVQFKPTGTEVNSATGRPRFQRYTSTLKRKGVLPATAGGPGEASAEAKDEERQAIHDLLLAVKSLDFAAVLGQAGLHNGVLSGGQLYEVNYYRGPEAAGLHGSGSFEKWAHWMCNGLLVVPPTEWAKLTAAAKDTAATGRTGKRLEPAGA